MAGRDEQAYRTGFQGAIHGVGESILPCAQWATRAALWLRDASRARPALEALESTAERGRYVATLRLGLRAGLQALEGDRDGAVGSYREALRAFRDMDVPLYHGLTAMECAILIGPDDPEAAAAADEARSIFARLGIPPLLRRLDEGLARSERPARRGAPAAAAEGTPATPAAAKP
jgi:hypothetical protein